MAAAEFRALPAEPLSEEAWDSPCPLGPDDLLSGHFESGMRYYVRAVKKPKDRASIALAVRIGSVVEEEHERGIAHIVEHLAFNATEKYESHELVSLLESLGCPFGACQNAYTSVDETVYELDVPTDEGLKPLEEALDMIAQFAHAIRCADGDLAKERGAVLEEWRSGRDSVGRTHEAHWKTLLEGTKYAERLPIGLKEIVETVPASTVHAFYRRWYRPENMAVIIAGDFDPAAVKQLIEAAMSNCHWPSVASPTPIPEYRLVPHSAPRYSVFTDKEAQQAQVHVTFKHEALPCATPRHYRRALTEDIFQTALNKRFFRISRQRHPPFYAAEAGTEGITQTIRAMVLTAVVQDGHAAEGLEAILTEVARVRAYGFSERELKYTHDYLLADYESLYVERDQVYAQEIRAEYVRHFLSDEFVVGREKEARLFKSIIDKITAEDVQQVAEQLRSSASCVVKAVSHRRGVSEEELAAVVARVDAAEREGTLERWAQEDAPTAVIPEGQEPQPGTIEGRRHWPELDATVLQLGNGMKVFYKVTEFMDDQILMTGFAPGGLSQAPQSFFRTASLSAPLAQEQGIFGIKPEVMGDILMGKRCDLKTDHGAFWRRFAGEQSPENLETAMQLVHKLFTTTLEPIPGELDTYMRNLRDMLEAQLRNPAQRFMARVRQVCYEGCYYFEPPTVADLDKLDLPAAFRYFSRSFQNPAEFTLCFTGSLKVEEFERLVQQYLASIPVPEDGEPVPVSLVDITPLPGSFPKGVITEIVRAPMISPMAEALISFPVEISLKDAVSATLETNWTTLCTMVLENRLMSVMRFQKGDVYGVHVSRFAGKTAPSEMVVSKQDASISFQCSPANAQRLVQLALSQLADLQEKGPTAEEVAKVTKVEQRKWETVLQENLFWHELLVNMLQHREYFKTGDLDKAFLMRKECRAKVNAEASPETMHAAFQRLFPMPCRSRHVALCLLPQQPLAARLVSPPTAATVCRPASIIAEASRAILPSRDKPAAYWVTTAVILAGALTGLALLRKR
ncbi:g4987 [Coccomyxa viridis]|uniref:G4987 protein n=1 Tax=Coccomyxa viridis TaxID=1274662 RepID=A0ABP1FT36_9CHLO